MLNAELKILAGKYQGKAIPLSTKRFLVGREQDCQLRPNSELVSRHHCVFVIDDYAVRLRDLGSTNGTRVNGDLVRGEIVLKPGDKVIIGRLEVELVIRQTAAVVSAVPAGEPVAASASATISLPTIEQPIELAATNPANSGDTNFEIPILPQSPTDQSTMANFGGDTAIIPGANAAPMAPFANPQQMMPMGYPQMGYGYPMQGQTPGYPGMPGYGYGMPQGYPMGMPGMPMMPQQYPQQPYPQMPAAAPASTPAGNAATVAEQPVRLPDPTTTGAKVPAPKPVVPAVPGQAPAATPENPSQSAADIIKQFMHRRTT